MLCGVLLACGVAGIAPARAAELSSIDGFDIRWDNDLRYSAGVRVASPAAISLGYPTATMATAISPAD